MAAPGSLLEYDPSEAEDWETRAPRFKYFVSYQDITAEAKKKALPLSACSNTMLKACQQPHRTPDNRRGYHHPDTRSTDQAPHTQALQVGPLPGF